MYSPENIVTTTSATTAAISAATLPLDTVSIQGQQHCSMHGHYLRLEEDQSNILAKSPGLQSPSRIVTSSGLLASPVALEVFESSRLEESATTSCEKLINLTQPIISMSAARNSENSRSIVPKPSGIGLQLDSVINAMPIGCATTGGMVSAERHYLNIEWRKVVSIMGCHQPEISENCSILSNVREKVSANSEDGIHETQASVATSSIVSQPPQFLKHSNDPALLKQCEYQTIPYDKRKSTFEHDDYQSSPRRISEKPLATNDGEGCKHCNCKRTKCLKLYCDCFAAGIYCDESCSCQNCFNRPEYEDTVLDSRQQIESRNPLAFSPKVVKHVTDIPATSYMEDRNKSTLSSSRHKRGCNCKKSMCLKKYCECYQATVGCFNGCRCEGCKNVYGRKEEYDVTKDMLSKGLIHEGFKNIFDEKQEMVSGQEGFLPKLCNPHNLMPLRPSFQFLHHGKDASKYQFSTQRSHQSPESNLSFFPPYEKLSVSSGNSENYEMLVEASKQIEYIAYRHQERDYSNTETVDQLSPRYGLDSAFNLSRLPSSVSSTISGAPLCPRSGHLSSMNSLYWHGLPNTAVSQFCGSDLCQGVDSIKELHNIPEDDMPQTLKNISTPLNAVQVSSPNRKRVSSPRSSLQVPGSSSSIGLGSDQTYIAGPGFYPSSFTITDSKETKYK